jgi:hypothetical protein
MKAFTVLADKNAATPRSTSWPVVRRVRDEIIRASEDSPKCFSYRTNPATLASKVTPVRRVAVTSIAV